MWLRAQPPPGSSAGGRLVLARAEARAPALGGANEHAPSSMPARGVRPSAGIANVRPVAEFAGSDLSGSRFERVDLTGAQFRAVDLSHARLRGVDGVDVAHLWATRSWTGATPTGP